MSAELFEALETHDLNRLSALLRAGANPNFLKEQWPGWSPLYAAIDELEDGGPLDALIVLLRHGARIEVSASSTEASPLLMALSRRQPAAVRLLLGAGADTNVRDGEGDSPLRVCVEQGEHSLATLLLACGATQTIDDSGGPSGMSALGRAASLLDVPMLKLLLRAGANPQALDADARTARERLPTRTSDNALTWDAASALLAVPRP